MEVRAARPWSHPSGTLSLPPMGVGAQTRGPGLATVSQGSSLAHTGKSSPFQPKEPHFTQRQVPFNRNPFLSLWLHPLPTHQGPGET